MSPSEHTGRHLHPKRLLMATAKQGLCVQDIRLPKEPAFNSYLTAKQLALAEVKRSLPLNRTGL